MADINGDGLLDIYVCSVQGEHGLEGRNQLFINNGNGNFTESAEKYGLALSAYSTQAVFFDYDHDGDLDCFVLNQSHHPNQILLIPVIAESSIPMQAAAFTEMTSTPRESLQT